MNDAPDDWDLETATVQQARRPATSAFSVRLNREELAALRKAAKAAGIAAGEFIRRAALEKARAGEIPAAFVGGTHLLGRVGGVRRGRRPVR